MSLTVGIIGAGKLGIALAKVATSAGLEVWITSRNVPSTRLIAEVMAPGVKVGTRGEVVANSELIVLALPLHRLNDLPTDALAGKIVVDAINHWEPVDGPMERYGVAKAATSSLVQAQFEGIRLVKGLNQLGYHDVEDGPRPAGAADRLGVAVAGDDADAKSAVMELVESLGFDAVDAGSLAEGERLGPGGPAFGATLTAPELRKALG